MSPVPDLPFASLPRRLASLAYEALLLAAVLFLAGFVVVGLLPGEPPAPAFWAYRFYLLLVAGVYFTWFWRHGGQTLAMKTWRFRLVAADGGALSRGMAWRRYALAVLGLSGFGLGFAWALVDREHQFLHDRLAGTRLVSVGSAVRSGPG
jgi:uncharacterized RDD family membrane protein YckC